MRLSDIMCRDCQSQYSGHVIRTSILIFKHYIFLIVCSFLGCFQCNALAYAGVDSEVSQLSATTPDDGYKNLHAEQVFSDVNSLDATGPEVHSVAEGSSEQGSELIYSEQKTDKENLLPIFDSKSLNHQNDIKTVSSTVPEEPVYQKVKEVGGDWIKWIKWFFFFLMLSLTLTPFTIMLISRNAAMIYAVGAFVGAERSKEGAVKGAANGIRVTTAIILLCIFLGPYGMLYCIYHPILAFFSDADRTYCCTMTWIGHDSISKKSISADGHWLAEVQEQSHEYLGLGNKQFVEENVLSVMNLTTGKHVMWPQSGKKLLGVKPDHSQIQEVVIDDGVWIRPTNYLSSEIKWYSVELGNNFLQPVNHERTGQVLVRYQLLGNQDQQNGQLQFIDVKTGHVHVIKTDMQYDRHYLSYDGRVLALVKGPEQEKSTDGLIRQIMLMANSYLFESWKIEFWNVATGKRIATYSGHGINQDAWIMDRLEGRQGLTRFLESSSDGRFWYMIKSDGYIHVFDMSKHIPLAERHFG